MQFADVIGQKGLKQRLLSSLAAGRVSHAQLFSGAPGRGNLAMALAYAQYVNCQNPGENDSCGVCSSCQKSAKIIHPDIHFSFPFFNVAKKKELSTDWLPEWRKALLENPYITLTDWLNQMGDANKQVNIPIRECHDIIRRLTLKSFEGKWKILILWLPEYLGKEGNSLLKTIEEPPEKTLILLVAENQEAILNTILSRTQIVPFPPVDTEDIIQGLVKQKSLEQEQAGYFAGLSAGNFATALELVEQSHETLHEFIRNWVRLTFAYGKTQALPELQALMDFLEKIQQLGRERQKNLLRNFLHYLEEAVKIRFCQDRLPLSSTGKDLNMVEWMSKAINLNQVEQLSNLLTETEYLIARNGNGKMLLFNLSLKISDLLHRRIIKNYNKELIS